MSERTKRGGISSFSHSTSRRSNPPLHLPSGSPDGAPAQRRHEARSRTARVGRTGWAEVMERRVLLSAAADSVAAAALGATAAEGPQQQDLVTLDWNGQAAQARAGQWLVRVDVPEATPDRRAGRFAR